MGFWGVSFTLFLIACPFRLAVGCFEELADRDDALPNRIADIDSLKEIPGFSSKTPEALTSLLANLSPQTAEAIKLRIADEIDETSGKRAIKLPQGLHARKISNIFWDIVRRYQDEHPDSKIENSWLASGGPLHLALEKLDPVHSYDPDIYRRFTEEGLLRLSEIPNLQKDEQAGLIGLFGHLPEEQQDELKQHMQKNFKLNEVKAALDGNVMPARRLLGFLRKALGYHNQWAARNKGRTKIDLADLAGNYRAVKTIARLQKMNETPPRPKSDMYFDALKAIPDFSFRTPEALSSLLLTLGPEQRKPLQERIDRLLMASGRSALNGDSKKAETEITEIFKDIVEAYNVVHPKSKIDPKKLSSPTGMTAALDKLDPGLSYDTELQKAFSSEGILPIKALPRVYDHERDVLMKLLGHLPSRDQERLRQHLEQHFNKQEVDKASEGTVLSARRLIKFLTKAVEAHNRWAKSSGSKDLLSIDDFRTLQKSERAIAIWQKLNTPAEKLQEIASYKAASDYITNYYRPKPEWITQFLRETEEDTGDEQKEAGGFRGLRSVYGFRSQPAKTFKTLVRNFPDSMKEPFEIMIDKTIKEYDVENALRDRGDSFYRILDVYCAIIRAHNDLVKKNKRTRPIDFNQAATYEGTRAAVRLLWGAQY